MIVFRPPTSASVIVELNQFTGLCVKAGKSTEQSASNCVLLMIRNFKPVPPMTPMTTDPEDLFVVKRPAVEAEAESVYGFDFAG